MRQALLVVLVIGCVIVPGALARGGAHTSGAVWKLTPVACPSGWVELGRGCYDQGARNFESTTWDVHEGSTTWDDPQYHVEFTYTVPATVGPSGGAVQLGVNAQSITSGSGIDARLCALSTFAGISGSDNCAIAHPKTAHSSESATKTLHLEGAAGAPGATQTVTIYIGSGHLVFTYRAQKTAGGGSGNSKSSALTVSYRFTDKGKSGDESVAFHATGSFVLSHIPSAHTTAHGSKLKGHATLEVHAGAKRYSLGLTPKSVTFRKFAETTDVIVVFTVTHSTVTCFPVGSQITMHARDEGAGDESVTFSSDKCGGIPNVPSKSSFQIHIS